MMVSPPLPLTHISPWASHVIAALIGGLATACVASRLRAAQARRHGSVTADLGAGAGTALDTAEAALHEERYALAARAANDALWDWNIETGEIYFSPRWSAMLGDAHTDATRTPEDWLARVHPDDIGALRDLFAVHIAGGSADFESEHRLQHVDGSYRWVLCRATVVRNDAGTATRMAGAATDVTSRKQQEERLRHDAYHDQLTGLPNRAYFTDLLARAHAHAVKRHDHQFAVLFLDCDRLKLVNDTLGHLAGDALLRGIAGRLLECVRPGDVVARIGGDEFTILLNGLTSPTDALHVADRVQRALAEPLHVNGHELYTSASVGIALHSASSEQPEDVLRDADLAMYRAKEQGRGRREVFVPEMRTRAMAHLAIEGDLRRALERRELRVVYQPIASLRTGRIAGAEALLRWAHPERGVIAPSDFVPIAEETGYIIAIGAWVLNTACQEARRWQGLVRTGEPFVVGVNVSAKQLLHPEFILTVRTALQRAELPPECLCLEITEGIISADATVATATLRQLHDMGVRLAMDDFGTGHSSLSYLHRLPIATVKIDQYFVGRMDTASDCFEIVRTVVALAKNLGMDVVAEGVETPAQLAMLQSLGGEYIQGFLLSRPLEASAIDPLISASDISGVRGIASV